jgi:Ser/Thr protein kinase RdoA (MazF antagonist)
LSISRRPYRYATSFPLDEIDLQLDDGRSVALILKDLTWQRLPEDARLGKPKFLYEPRREIETYRRILKPLELGPRCFGAQHDPSGSGSWLVLEKLRGVELWQVGDLALWDEAARWIARLHARFLVLDVLDLNPYLLHCDADWFRAWATRAKEKLGESDDRRSRFLIDVLDGYHSIAECLAALPRTFVHGEYFPSNVLVDPQHTLVWPVDWEMSAAGPCLLDVAALVTGWDDDHRQRFLEAYRQEAVEHGVALGTIDDVLDGVRMCQLHFALQWMGWSKHWTPPSEHARDWLGDALTSAMELSLR